MTTTKTPPGQLPDMPINPEWVTAGNPVARGAILIQSADRKCHQGLWECSPGEFDWTFTWDEFARLTEGEVTISEASGKTYTLGPGDLAHFPLGLKTHWKVRKTVKKVFFLRTPEPL
jgi:YD repeat-containing protein